MAEYEKFVREATRGGPELEAIADRLYAEMPEVCTNCPMAFAVRCAVSESNWWLPLTPSGVRRISFEMPGGSYSHSNVAEFSLRSIVKHANEGNPTGPRGEDDSVCCQDTRDIQHADYSDDHH